VVVEVAAGRAKGSLLGVDLPSSSEVENLLIFQRFCVS